ncbi:MAG: sulfurtransferase [Thiobacillus sp.]|nr:sulfurtransferase [Thiobacillus sp.]
MKKLLAMLALVAGSLSLAACGQPPYENVDNAQLKALVAEGVPLYDIRRPEEWQQTGVVEGSRRLTWVDAGGRVQPGFFETLAAEAPKDKPVALICRTGSRTDRLARELMEKHGYTRVYNVRHGITGWIADRQPVTRN